MRIDISELWPWGLGFLVSFGSHVLLDKLLSQHSIGRLNGCAVKINACQCKREGHQNLAHHTHIYTKSDPYKDNSNYICVILFIISSSIICRFKCLSYLKSGGCWLAIHFFLIDHQLKFFFSEIDSNNMNPLHCYYYSCGSNVPIPFELKLFLNFIVIVVIVLGASSS